MRRLQRKKNLKEKEPPNKKIDFNSKKSKIKWWVLFIIGMLEKNE
jgi:hypothetical protein